MFAILVAAIVGLMLADVANATTHTVHGSVIFSLTGDRTPNLAPGEFILTPLGAQQLYASGSAFRARYIAPPAEKYAQNVTRLPIRGLSTYSIDNSQIYVSAVDSFHAVNSAQAFLQGLYPPIGYLTSSPDLLSEYILANGSVIDYPLNGYQYCPIHTYRLTDPNLLWLAGDVNCARYFLSVHEYYGSDEFARINKSTLAFYQDIAAKVLLHRVAPDTTAEYYNAYDIYDYVNYGYTHTEWVKNNISSDDLTQLRALASQQMFEFNGNMSVSGFTQGDMIRTIAGQTFAAKVVGLLQDHIDSQGVFGKLSIMFGDLEPFLALFALAGLANVNSHFKGLPEFGSAMVFEVFSLDASDNQTSYPSESDLWVRFLFRNGTSDNQSLIAYSLFGQGRSNTDMKWSDFKSQIGKFMMPKVRDWCNTCGSINTFCPYYTGHCSYSRSAGFLSHGGVTPQVAGVIGAAVTLGVIGLVVAALFFGGIRFNRSSGKRRSELGGFKGSQKLASDADLTSGKAPTGAAAARGHERVGSWELGESKAEEQGFGSLHRPRSLPPRDGDDLSVNPFSEPVKVEDRV